MACWRRASSAFAVERAVFVATLHRLFVSGSDRDCVSWMADYDIGGAQAFCLHHFYRAMAWLGETVEAASGPSPAPRCIKDVIEERLFERRRGLSALLPARPDRAETKNCTGTGYKNRLRCAPLWNSQKNCQVPSVGL